MPTDPLNCCLVRVRPTNGGGGGVQRGRTTPHPIQYERGVVPPFVLNPIRTPPIQFRPPSTQFSTNSTPIQFSTTIQFSTNGGDPTQKRNGITNERTGISYRPECMDPTTQYPTEPNARCPTPPPPPPTL